MNCPSSREPTRRSWRWLGRLARWGLAAVFLYAGIAKALDPAELAEEIRNYRLAPWWLVHPLAIVLPWLEIVAGLLLAAGMWVVESAVVLAGLLLIFIAASAWALWWGLDIECGCFGGDARAGWSTIIRNLGLLIVAAVALYAHRRLVSARSPSRA